MSILLTAFEPFGGNERNISLDTLHALPDSVGETILHKAVLPVSYKSAPLKLRSLIEQTQPEVVIMLGQCAEGENIRLERYAHNLMDSTKADNTNTLVGAGK